MGRRKGLHCPIVGQSHPQCCDHSQGQRIWWISADLTLELLYLCPGSSVGRRGVPLQLLVVVVVG